MSRICLKNPVLCAFPSELSHKQDLFDSKHNSNSYCYLLLLLLSSLLLTDKSQVQISIKSEISFVICSTRAPRKLCYKEYTDRTLSVERGKGEDWTPAFMCRGQENEALNTQHLRLLFKISCHKSLSFIITQRMFCVTTYLPMPTESM